MGSAIPEHAVQPRMHAATPRAGAFADRADVVALVVFVVVDLLLVRASGASRGVSWGEAGILATAMGSFWLVVAIGVRHLVRTVERGTLRRGVEWLVAAPVVCAAGALHGWLAATIALRPAFPVAAAVVHMLDVHLLLYVIIVFARRLQAATAKRARAGREALALQRDLDDARIRQLGSQLQPHFLLNTLNVIAEHAVESPARARLMLEQLRALFVHASRRMEQPLVSLSEELETLRPYVLLQEARFAGQLHVRIDVSDAARAAALPPMLLQPLVENAVRHGLAHGRPDAEVCVEARVANDRLTLTVTDNGVGITGIPGTTGHGIGLRNTVERLQRLFGDVFEFSLRPRQSGGVQVMLRLPVRAPSSPAVDASASSTGADAVTDAASEHIDRLRGGEVTKPVASDTHAPERRQTFVRPLAIWIGVAVLWTLQNMLEFVFRGTFQWRFAVADAKANGVAALLWLLLTPLVWRLDAALCARLRRPSALVATHVAISIVIAYAHLALVSASGVLGDRRLLAPSNINPLFLNVSIYLTMITWRHLRRIRDWLAARALAADQLTTELAVARWGSHAAHLDPALVASALDEMAVRVEAAPRATEQDIVRLAHAFQPVLRRAGAAECALEEDLDALQGWLAIRAIAIPATPTIAVTAEPGCVRTLVPCGFTRALVEPWLIHARDDIALDARTPSPGVLTLTVRHSTRTALSPAEMARLVRAALQAPSHMLRGASVAPSGGSEEPGVEVTIHGVTNDAPRATAEPAGAAVRA